MPEYTSCCLCCGDNLQKILIIHMQNTFVREFFQGIFRLSGLISYLVRSKVGEDCIRGQLDRQIDGQAALEIFRQSFKFIALGVKGCRRFRDYGG